MMRNCPTCATQMQKRAGRYGDFWFCPRQSQCGQKTITASSGSSTSRDKRPAGRATIDNHDVVFGGMFCDMGQDFDDDLGMG